MKRKSIISILFLLVFLSIAKSNMFAQEQSLSIYPPVIEIQTTPPSSPLVPIIVQNNVESDLLLQIELIPFKTNNITGEINLLPNDISKGFYPYYRDRIQFLVDGKKSNTISLAPLESKEVGLNINLSKGDPPGDFYYSIVFINQQGGPIGSSVSQMPAGIATNLLLSVGPKDESSGSISQFKTSSFKTNGPVEFELKVHNSSKHLINPTGSVQIKNLFGQSVGSVKILPQYILAGSDRFMLDDKQSSPEAQLAFQQLNSTPKVIWPETFLLGWYEAKATILLEEDGRRFTQSLYFFAFPMYLFFPLVAVIFIILSIYLRVKKKI